MADFRLPQSRKWTLRPSGTSRNVDGKVVTDVSEQPISSIFKIKQSVQLGVLNLDEGTDRLSRNFGN